MSRKGMVWLVLALAVSLAPPANADSFFNQGTNYLDQQQYAKAIACFDHSIKGSAKFAPSYLNRGVAYSRAGYAQKALDDYLMFIKLEPDHYVGYSNAATSYISMNNMPKAIEFLTKGIEMIKQDREDYKKVPSLYYERAHVYFMMRDYKKALDDCQKIRSIPSQRKTTTFAEATKMAITCQQGMAQQVRSYQSQATTMIQRSDFDGALKSISAAIDIEPQSLDSYLVRARAHAGQGQFDKAHQDIAKVLSGNPKDSRTIVLRSEVYTKQHEFAKALQDIEEVSSTGQKSYDLLLSHASLSILLNRLPQAQKDIDEVLTMRPNDAKATQYKALLCLSSGKTDEAVADLASIIETGNWSTPAPHRSSLMAYEILMKQGKTEQAKKILEQAAGKLTPENELLWPAPAVKYLTGKLDSAGLLAAARNRQEETEARSLLMLEETRAGQSDKVREHQDWIAKKADPTSLEVITANRLMSPAPQTEAGGI